MFVNLSTLFHPHRHCLGSGPQHLLPGPSPLSLHGLSVFSHGPLFDPRHHGQNNFATVHLVLCSSCSWKPFNDSLWSPGSSLNSLPGYSWQRLCVLLSLISCQASIYTTPPWQANTLRCFESRLKRHFHWDIFWGRQGLVIVHISIMARIVLSPCGLWVGLPARRQVSQELLSPQSLALPSPDLAEWA